jgi:hypothetical protein
VRGQQIEFIASTDLALSKAAAIGGRLMSLLQFISIVSANLSRSC